MGTAIIFLVIGLAMGGALSYVLKRSDSNLQRRNEELKKQLEDADQNLTAYKQDVANHFMKTADLINNMTDSYRSVHEHLAQGANALCSEQLGVEQLDIRQTKLLDKADAAKIPEVEIEASKGTALPEEDLTAQEHPESVIAKEPQTELDKQTVH